MYDGQLVAQLHSGYCGIMVAMGYLVESSLEKLLRGNLEMIVLQL